VEPTRLLLAAAGVEYEDKRYAVDMTTKPPSAPEFNSDKESGITRYALIPCRVHSFQSSAPADWTLQRLSSLRSTGALAANMGRAPILDVDGAQIGQSHG